MEIGGIAAAAAILLLIIAAVVVGGGVLRRHRQGGGAPIIHNKPTIREFLVDSSKGNDLVPSNFLF